MCEPPPPYSTDCLTLHLKVNFLGSLGSKEPGAGYDSWEIEYSRKLRLGYGAMGAKPALFQIEYETRDPLTGKFVKVSEGKAQMGSPRRGARSLTRHAVAEFGLTRLATGGKQERVRVGIEVGWSREKRGVA